MKHAALVVLATVLSAVVAVPVVAAAPPDARPGARGPGAVLIVGETAVPASTHPDARPGPRGPGPGVVATVGSPTVDGFDWRDAGIGLAGGLVVALLAAAAAMTLSQRHQAQPLA